MNNNATLAKKGEIASATLLNDSTTDVSAIENSWARCREVGLAPSGKPIDAVTSDIDLSIIQEKKSKKLGNLYYLNSNYFIIKLPELILWSLMLIQAGLF